MNSVFKLAVVAMVFLALIYMINIYFQQPPDDLAKQLDESLDFVEIRQDLIETKTVNLPAGTGLSAANLDSKTRNVRFECTNAYACSGKDLEVDSRRIIANRATAIDVHFRCKDKKIINDCTIYFGLKPAHLEAEITNLKAQKTPGGTTTANFSIRNSGALDAIDTSYSFKVYSVKTIDNKETTILQYPIGSDITTIEKILTGETKTYSKSFSLESIGKHRVIIVADGEDAGRSIVEQEFTIGEPDDSECTATTTGKTTLTNGKCVTEFLCTGCTYGYQCLSAWNEKQAIDGEISKSTAEKLFAEKEPVEGACS